jgi:hypothetical protein
MDEVTARDISKIFLKTTGAIKARIQKGAEDRAASRQAVAEGKTPTGARTNFVRQTAVGVVKFLNKVANDFNEGQKELHVTMEDLVEALQVAKSFMNQKLKKKG